MSTIKVNTIQSNTTAGVDVNSPLETVPSIDVTGSASIGGGLNVTGVVTATSFSGSGANLTGIAATTDVRTNSLVVSGVSTLTTLNATSIVGVTTAGITTAYVGSINDGPLAGTRNLIINGGMDIWQRGTSQTTSGDYGADRFWMANAASATRSTDAPDGFTYSTKLTYSASDMALGQPIELPATGEQGQLVAGTILTLSYYAKVSSGTEGITTVINFRDAKFSASNQVSFTSSNPNATWTTDWARYQHQFTIPTVAGTNVLAGLEISGISKDAFITGVQLEAGSVATPFERRSFGQELALCQRYFELTSDIYYRTYNTSGSPYRMFTPFKVSKRNASSTVTVRTVGGDDFTGGTAGSVTISGSNYAVTSIITTSWSYTWETTSHPATTANLDVGWKLVISNEF